MLLNRLYSTSSYLSSRCDRINYILPSQDPGPVLIITMEAEFIDKKVLVTGAGAGIGRSLCIRLYELGAKVYAVSRSAPPLASLVAECPGVVTMLQDVSKWDETRVKIQAWPTMDYLVNNAGIGENSAFLDTPEEEVDRMFAVNFKPAINISQVFAKKLIGEGRPGAVVNVSSQASLRALAGHTSYGSSKAALDQLTRIMSLELAQHHIRVNSVNPTVTLTPMGELHWSDPEKAKPMLQRIPLNKFAVPKDVVDAILFLLSGQASMITGVLLPIDGGFTAC